MAINQCLPRGLSESNMAISFNSLTHYHHSHTLWCGQAATKAPEGTDRASFLVNAIDYVYSVKMVDSWEE
jgi:hypothetical protein